MAFLLYGIVLIRFGFMDLPAQYSSALPQAGDVPLGDYLLHLLERLVVFGVPIASIAGAYFLLKTPAGAGRLAVDQANDVAQWVRTHWAVRCSIILVLGMAFLFLHLELNRTLGYLFAPGRLPVLTLLWLGMCLLLLYEYLASPSRPVLAVLALFIARRARSSWCSSTCPPGSWRGHGVRRRLLLPGCPDAAARLRGDGGLLRPGVLAGWRGAATRSMRPSWPAGWRSAWRSCF